VESKLSWTWTPRWCGRPSSSFLSPWPSTSPCWSSPLFLINNTGMKPSVNSKKQLTRLERTWRSNCRARALVIGPCIVCKVEISSSSSLLTQKNLGPVVPGGSSSYGLTYIFRTSSQTSLFWPITPFQIRVGGKSGVPVSAKLCTVFLVAS
jgi:hypothetical protein